MNLFYAIAVIVTTHEILVYTVGYSQLQFQISLSIIGIEAVIIMPRKPKVLNTFEELFPACVIIIICFVIDIIFINYFSYMSTQPSNDEIYMSLSKKLLPPWFYICVGAPIAEELFWRGFAMRYVERSLPTMTALIVSSVGFAWAHGDWTFIPQHTASGMIFGIIALTNGIFGAIIVHMLLNTLIILKMF